MPPASLESVNLVNSLGVPIPGLVRLRDMDGIGLSVDERAAVLNAQQFKDLDFIFFRRFTDERSSHVAAYVVDNSDSRLDEAKLAELHRKVWLHGIAPLLYVAWPSRIDLLTCARGPDFWTLRDHECKYAPAKRLDLQGIKTGAAISAEARNLSAFRLADGTFWDDPANGELADNTEVAHHSLIQAVVEADLELDGKKNPILRRLLLLMVLIKYLEDRRVFPGDGWFGRFHKGAKTFFDVLRGGQPEEVSRLLDFLERKFDGGVFSLPESGRHKLTNASLSRFADLVEARTLKRQRYLWEQFSFEHLPVEVISHLYERFVEGGHGTVYTPPFLASLLLDYAMPYSTLRGDERVLDPACGSGLFLVGAFRRLVNAWRSRNDWQRPEVSTLKAILKRSIFGIDLDRNAIDLTAFSLRLALCDALLPPVIWGELTFDPLLDTNLLGGDFFDAITAKSRKSPLVDHEFDVIVGNPPFESKLSPSGERVDAAARREAKRPSLPDNQSAYLFLEQSLGLLNPKGRICLIQPSGLLYNRNASGFRAHVIGKYAVDTILDFTSIRKLYGAADPKTIAVCGRAVMPSDDHCIEHQTFRRTVSVQERICFEIDHYDRHRVPQHQALSDDFVWRADLLGGSRLLSLSQRLRSHRTLAQYVAERGWEYGEGFIAAKKGPRKPAPFLTGKPLLPTQALTESGIDSTQIARVVETRFRSAYTPARYTAPLILIKATESIPISFWEKGFIAYRDKIIGIHAPQSQVDDLRALYETLRRNRALYRLSCALNGTQFLVGKATAILKQDIDILPFPENVQDLDFCFWEDVLSEDVLKYMTEYVRLGQNSELLRRTVNPSDLEAYSRVFLRMLGSIYATLKAADAVHLGGLVCQPFYFGDPPDLSWLFVQAKDDLAKLIYEEKAHSRLRTIRVLRLYAENVLLLVKPDRLRYWIRSTAIRDADETLVDLRSEGF